MFYKKHYSEVKLEDVNVDGAKDVKIRWMLSKDNNTPNFAMRLFEIGKNGNTPNHSHNWEHEIFVVSGSGKLKYENEEYELFDGSIAYVPKSTNHQFIAGENGMKMICVIPNYGDGR
jgi:quercetin dioxygenase-like cupin family protein